MSVRRALKTDDLEIWECSECGGEGVVAGAHLGHVCYTCGGRGRARVKPGEHPRTHLAFDRGVVVNWLMGGQ